MTEYALYVESGPKRRKTMVHVLELLGCIAQGPTTEEALAATPQAVRAYLRFLRRHGEQVEPERLFTTAVAEHVMEGQWLGKGNPMPGFAPDFQPLTAQELKVYTRRLGWMQEELLGLVRGMSPERLLAKPETGRSLHGILAHVGGADYSYLMAPLSKPPGMAAAVRAVERGPEVLPAALARVWDLAAARLEALTESERREQMRHGQEVWTARRALRRMLEHAWEHLQEVSVRVERDQSV